MIQGRFRGINPQIGGDDKPSHFHKELRMNSISLSTVFRIVPIAAIILFGLSGCNLVEEVPGQADEPSQPPVVYKPDPPSANNPVVPEKIIPVSPAKETRSVPSTTFLEGNRQFTGIGSWWLQEFTLSGSTSLTLRFVSQFSGDAAILDPSQVKAFQSNQSFSGWCVFSSKMGTQYVTLPAGTYTVAMRSRVASPNSARLELDYRISLPASDRFQYYDMYTQEVESINPSGRLWQEIKIQEFGRYFLDGCNTGLDAYIIPESELNNFKAGLEFEYYTAYSGNDGSQPGLFEIELPVGIYYLAYANNSNEKQSVSYSLERWQHI
jgi:hypothetical protein